MGIIPILGKHYLLLVDLCKKVCKIEGHPVFEI